MDFATFTTETLSYLWRTNDTDLETNMPQIVRTAENRLRVDLKLTEEDVVLAVSVETTPSFDLPADCDVVSNLTWDDYGPGVYRTRRDFDKRKDWYLADCDYTIIGKAVHHRWDTASALTPTLATLTYTPVPTGLEAGDDTLFNAYTAAYEAAVYAEASMFLREEERALMFDQKYVARVDSARQDQSHKKYGGSPLTMSMPGVVA